MVLKNCGPKGYPGMAEVGNMPQPPKVLRKGISDMVRVSDARMSGTAYGTVVLHAAPEAAAGGPLAFVQTGDWVTLDTQAASFRWKYQMLISRVGKKAGRHRNYRWIVVTGNSMSIMCWGLIRGLIWIFWWENQGRRCCGRVIEKSPLPTQARARGRGVFVLILSFTQIL